MLQRFLKQRSAIEWVLILMICGLVVLIVIEKASILSVKAEHRAMQRTLFGLRRDVNIAVIKNLLAGTLDVMREKSCLNPVSLQATPPRNYIGEFQTVNTKSIPPGSWYFDKRHCWLVYFARHKKYFKSDNQDPRRVRFVLRSNSSTGNPNRSSRTNNLHLISLDTFHWLI